MEEWVERGGLCPRRRFGSGSDLGLIGALLDPIDAWSIALAKPSSVLRAALFFCGDPVGVTGGVGAAGQAIMVAVIGFLFCKDEDLSEACPS
jgi:hypothetical protein